MKITIANDFKNLLPEHTPEELKQLKANCMADRTHKVMPPVIIWEMSRSKWIIVDGHHQYDIRTKNRLGIKYHKAHFETRDEALRHALDVQFGRRNLSATERAAAYAKLPRRAEGRPQNSEDENSATLPSIPELAKAAGVSERTMGDAARVNDHGSADLIKAMSNDLVSASDAASIVDLPKPKQSAILKKKLAGTIPSCRAGRPKPRGKATDFDPAELEKQKGKAKRTKNGAPEVPAKARAHAKKQFGIFCRALSAIGVYPEFRVLLDQIGKRIGQR